MSRRTCAFVFFIFVKTPIHHGEAIRWVAELRVWGEAQGRGCHQEHVVRLIRLQLQYPCACKLEKAPVFSGIDPRLPVLEGSVGDLLRPAAHVIQDSCSHHPRVPFQESALQGDHGIPRDHFHPWAAPYGDLKSDTLSPIPVGLCSPKA